jgi:hypothetical protein
VTRRASVAVGLMAFFGIMFVVFGITDMLGGVLSDPGITVAIAGMSPAEVHAQDPVGYRLYDFATRTLGLSLIALGLLVTTIVLIPYRGGQRWSWAVMWWLPAWAISVPLLYLAFGVAPGSPPAPPMVSGPVIAGIAAVALLADRRRFRDERASQASLETEGAAG